MAWFGDPVWLADVLRAEGVKVVEFPGWRDRGHGDFKDVWGVMCHHTGASGSPGPNPIAYGVNGLAGPLSQIYLSRDGTATVVAVGVAWHAGMGEYPGLPTNNANWHTIGIEAENNGTEGWSPAQYDAYVRCCAAIVRRLGYGSNRVIGHKEWAGRAQGKWDPGGMDMNKFRADVQARLNPPKPVPQKTIGEIVSEGLNEIVEAMDGSKHRVKDLIRYTDGRVFEMSRKLDELLRIVKGGK